MDHLFAICCIAFGLLTLSLRIFAPERLGHLYRIEERFGRVPGRIVHFVAYTLLPLAFGLALLIRLRA